MFEPHSLSVVMTKIASLSGSPNLEEYFTEHNERGRQRGLGDGSKKPASDQPPQLLTIVLVETPQVGFLARYHLIHPHSHI